MSEKIIQALEANIKNRFGVYETTKRDLVGAFEQEINYLKNRVVELEKKLETNDTKANKKDKAEVKKGKK